MNDSKDPFYRYKRDIISVKHSVNFTEIENLTTIAKQLNRTDELLLKYLQVTLATQGNLSKRTLRGTFTVNQLEKLVKDFIKKYVLCGTCQNPETTINYKKGQLTCASCGAKTPVQIDGKIIKG